MGLGGLQQPATQQAPAAPAAAPAAPAEPAAEDPVAVLKRAKEMLDAGLITQEDYDAAKAKALGL
jgi:membrane protease subunit (stomatin/prohibitin family)